MGKNRKKKKPQNSNPMSNTEKADDSSSKEGTSGPPGLDSLAKVVEKAEKLSVKEEPEDVAGAPLVGQESETVPPEQRGAKPKSSIREQAVISGGVGEKSDQQFQIPKVKNIEEKKKWKCGKEGKKIDVYVNHLEMKIKPNSSVFKYSVEVQAPWKRPNRKSDSELFIRGFERLKSENKGQFPVAHGVVFDGQAIAFSTRKLFGASGCQFEGSVEVNEVVDIDRKVKLIFKMNLVGEVDVEEPIKDYCHRGSTQMMMDQTSAVVTVINTLLTYLTKIDTTKVCIGRSAFSPPKPGVTELGGGKALWTGLFASFRPAWKPFLNVDMANKPGYSQASVMDFLLKQNERLNLENLQTKDVKILSDAIKGLKIRYFMPDGQKRDYRAVGLGPKPNERVVEMEENKPKISVIDYFKNEKKFILKHPRLLTLQVGNPDRKIFIPMELCEVKEQACPNSKKLSEKETSNMIKQTALPPKERMNKTLDKVKEMNNNLSQNKYVSEFGLAIADNFTKIGARCLPPPEIGYKKNATDLEKVHVRNGKWDMERTQHFVTCKSLDIWGVLDLSSLTHNRRDHLTDKEGKIFIDGLYEEGKKCGFNIDYPTYFKLERGETIEKSFERTYNTIKKERKNEPQLIMIFTADKSGPTYPLIKRMGDAEFLVPTQFVLTKNVRGKPHNRVPGPDVATLHNICLKLNSKLGGTNQVLQTKDLDSNFSLKSPVMFIGADVTHPSPDQIGTKPSIAAMVASMDPKISVYHCECRLQTGGQVVEVIEDTQDMVYRLLKRFYETNKGRKPEKLIYYRDGVSEGQFMDVMNRELSAMRRACMKLERGYEPGVTFVVAQKRHKTRLYPTNDRETVGRNKNVMPGTVVDTVITNPTEESFFLASHEGIQGTTRPTCYHKLYDDNDLSPDWLQKLTYYLCHLYARCQRSVSYPAPTYYAHLAAFRARDHHNALIELGKQDDENALAKIKHLLLTDYFI